MTGWIDHILEYDIIDRAHLLGHFGVKATVERLREFGHQWPSMVSDVTSRLKQCIPCQRFTVVRHGHHTLTPITASLPMDHLAIDCALSFQTSPRGNNVLLIIVDVCNRFVFLRPMQDKSARSVALNLLSIFIDFGFPKILQSDNGAESVNTVIAALTSEFAIDHRLVTPYHPRANGLAERFVQTACRSIKKLLEGDEA